MTSAGKSILAAFTLAVLMTCAAQEAHADPLIFTVTNSGQVAAPGSSVTLAGFYTNPGTQDFILTAIFIGNPNPAVTFTSTGFTFPTVAPLASTGDAPLLTVTFADDANAGVYDLFFGVRGYNPVGPAFEDSNLALFRVTVLSPQPVPEPATMLLLGSGFAGMALAARRRRRAMRSQ